MDRRGVGLQEEAQLSHLIRGDRLVRASEDAYGEGLTGPMPVGPVSSTGLSRAVRAQFREPVNRV